MTKDTPQIRFKGFTDAWEQRKFVTLLDKSDGIRRGPFGSAIRKDMFVEESDYVVYEQQNAIYDKYETRYNITKEKYNELIRFKVNPGDFIMSGAGTIGRISRVPKGIKKGVFNQALIRMKVSSNITDPDYFLHWLRSDDMQRRLTAANPASAMENLVPMSEVKEWEVLVPQIEEQELLGQLLTNLDNLITLQQRKLEAMQKLKQGYIQQLFPQEGETVPRMRFAEFEKPWEQRKLGEIVAFRRGLTYSPSDVSENGVRVLRSSNIDEDTFVLRDDDVFVEEQAVKIDLVNEDDILITSANGSSRLVGKHALIKDIDDKTVHGGFMLVASANNPVFVNALMSASWYAKFIKVYVTGGNGAIGNLSKSDLEEHLVLVPSATEQTVIGEFFHNSNRQITAQAQEVEQIKRLKAAYLQKMFV